MDLLQDQAIGFTVQPNDRGEMIPPMEKHYHTSKHASRVDVKWVIDQVDPDVIIPVRTKNRQWFRALRERATRGGGKAV